MSVQNLPYGSSQQYLVTVTINGVPYGTWNKCTGGDAASSPVKDRPGGMGDEIAYFALPVYADVTVTRVFDIKVDQQNLATLNPLVGRVYGSVTQQPLDPFGVPYGNPTVFTGLMKAIKPGPTDSNSNSPRTWDIDFEVTSRIN